MLGLALLAPASAHVPHDNIAALAAPAALDGSFPWLLLANPQGNTLLLRSDDAGETWSFVGGEPIVDEPFGATMLDDGTAVLLATERYWWTNDAGRTWQVDELPGTSRTLAGGERLTLGGADGIWEGTPGALTRVFDRPVARLGPGPSAVDTEGSVWVRTGDGWESIVAPDGVSVTVVGATGTAVYAGASDGTVWRWDGAWSPCGAVESDERPTIVALAVTDDAVTVATAERAGWTSFDACESWEDRTVPIEVMYEVEGGAESEAEAWTVLLANGATRVAAGWAGIYTSANGGRTWVDAPVVPADHTRGITFSDAFATDGLLYIGGYGAGVLRTTDGGVTFDAPDHGMTPENVQRVLTTGDPSDTGTIFAVSGHSAWISDDRGTNWTSFAPWTGMNELLPWCSADRAWVLVDAEEGVFETEDRGETWDPVILPLDGANPGGAVRVGEAVCVTAHKPVTVACGKDDDWSIVYTSENRLTTPPVAWPPSQPTRLVVSDEGAVLVTDDLGESWTTTWESDDRVVLLVTADDGTLFGATYSGRLLRSTDGGDTWTASEWRFTAIPAVLAPRPAFATHPDVLVGTHDGVWLVSGDGEPERFGGWQRIDDGSDFWRRRDAPARLDDPTASMDSLQPLAEESSITTWLRGDRVRVLGVSDGVGRITLQVDGEEVATLGEVATDGVEVLADVDGLGEGWHRVNLVGVAQGAAIDAVEGWSDGATLSDVADGVEPAPGPCTPVGTQIEAPGSIPPIEGCGQGCGGEGAAALLLPMLLRVRRRSG